MTSYPTPHDLVRIEVMGPHFTKYHLGGGRVLHHFTRAEDAHFHSHPWPFRTSILHGGYRETLLERCADGTVAQATVERLPETSHEVAANAIHKLDGLLGEDCWTLVEPGDWQQQPGFYDPRPDGLYYRQWDEPEFRLLAPVLEVV